jgi:dihydroxyacetone kinase-like predicted kinase
MDGLNRVLNGEEITSEESAGEKNPAAAASTESFGPDSVMTYGYCTELLVQLQNSKCDTEAYDIEELRAFLAELGDSIVAFKTDSIVKLHVHTFTPEKVLTKMREVGEFITVKIENMSLQHTSIVEEEKKSSSLTTGEFSKKLPESETNSENAAPVLKTNAVVAVSNGEGIDALFRELGADETVSGGQTNNPSAQDFLDAFEKINAENIFVYPNNSNIFLAANQAAGIYEKAKVHVIPSKSIGTGYVALATMDLTNTNPEEIIEAANAAIASVVCGYVSPAIRDTQMNGIEIKNGDTIGIIGKEIVVDDPDRVTAALELASVMLKDGRYMMTVFRGKDADEQECSALEAKINEAFPEVEIYTIDAGQEIYPYIFVAE